MKCYRGWTWVLILISRAISSLAKLYNLKGVPTM